ncbi:helix-turn-helix transcriptional regulator [Microbacterium jejuense]|uniref:Helix-turn-helix transcriptional regulator n=1 Tax=Microbacterium jejuense TaxID=1263637 RepID=A0ABS7HJN4_9MICO|nr:helix-turn-helix transcriptional regulator [Microbacterium jejuense]MBW9093033.1 helix-turn-helix transcriptional regulator [Microbacterium jejuense]
MIEIETTWNLRAVMATRGIFQTTKLGPLLAERGVELSREQIFRLVTATPSRVSLHVLAALTDALDCSMDDLVTVTRREIAVRKAVGEAEPSQGIGDLRPIRANIRRPREQ